MKKFFTSLIFVVLITFFSAGYAYSAETSLTWERSQMQFIEVDSKTASLINSLYIIGEGEKLEFNRVEAVNEAQRVVFQALIPTSFPLGIYSIRADLEGSTSKNLSEIRVVEYQSESYNPLLDPKTVGALSLTLFSLLTVWAISDAQTKRDRDFEDDQTTFGGIDGGNIGRSTLEHRDFRRSIVTSIYFDQLRSSWTILSNRYFPLISRVIADGGYLQYSLGVLVLLFPIMGSLLGSLAFQDIAGNGGITTPVFTLVASILVLSALDASAGLAATVVFGLCAITSQRFGNAYDFRTFLGLAALWIGPSFFANATRAIRRSRRDSDSWERITDVIVGSFVAGWAVKSLVMALDGFAHLKLPLHAYDNELGVITGLAIALRYLIEGYVNARNPYYLSYLSPRDLNEQNTYLRLLGWIVKGLLFIFFAISFLGMSWQLWAGLALLLIPQILKSVKDLIPNSSLIFQLVPVGVPALVFMYLLNEGYSKYLFTLDLDPASASRTLFILAAIPAFLISILKLVGRNPRQGDVRWYLRPQFTILYKTFGPLLFLLHLSISFGLVGI